MSDHETRNDRADDPQEPSRRPADSIIVIPPDQILSVGLADALFDWLAAENVRANLKAGGEQDARSLDL